MAFIIISGVEYLLFITFAKFINQAFNYINLLIIKTGNINAFGFVINFSTLNTKLKVNRYVGSKGLSYI